MNAARSVIPHGMTVAGERKIDRGPTDLECPVAPRIAVKPEISGYELRGLMLSA